MSGKVDYSKNARISSRLNNNSKRAASKTMGYSSVSADMAPAIRTQPLIEAGSDAITRYQLKTLQEKNTKEAAAKSSHMELWEGVFHRRAMIFKEIRALQADMDKLLASERRDEVLRTVGE